MAFGPLSGVRYAVEYNVCQTFEVPDFVFLLLYAFYYYAVLLQMQQFTPVAVVLARRTVKSRRKRAKVGFIASVFYHHHSELFCFFAPPTLISLNCLLSVKLVCCWRKPDYLRLETKILI